VIAVLEPAALAAGAALAVPFIVHWLRRADRRHVDFAALRFLRERDHPRAERRLRDRGLLALRLMLIGSIVLLLAAPAWRPAAQASVPWIVVAPGLSAEAAHGAVGSAASSGEWHWLAPGFPPLGATAPAAAMLNAATGPTSSLLRELDDAMPARAPLTLVVPEDLAGLDAERVQLAREFQWRVLPGSSPETALLGGAAPSTRPTVVIRYEAAARSELAVARALAAAWLADPATPLERAAAIDEAPATVPLPDPPAWLVWLGGSPTPTVCAWAQRGGRVLALEQALDIDLQQPQFDTRLLDPALPRRLARLLAAPTHAPDRAFAADVQPLHRAAIRLEAPRRLDAELAALVVLLSLLERIAAWRRAQRPGAPARPAPPP
jgi:hypothetical protein